jgi:hypothetical protein
MGWWPAEDRYIHFTPKARADEIVRIGKLLQRPPYEKSGIDTVTAVSLVWGGLCLACSSLTPRSTPRSSTS